MKISYRTGVLSMGVLGISALIFAGCSTRTQSAETEPIAQAPQTATSEQTAQPEKTAPAPKAIKWEKSLDAALAQAHKTQKPVMIDFFATWCGPCKMLDAKIYPSAPVVQEAQNFVSVKVDVDQQKDLAMKYQIQAMPTIVFLDASGREVHRTQGVSDEASWFVQEMQTARSKISVTAA